MTTKQRPDIKTHANLEAAFAGESMAHIKYRYFAKLAREMGDEATIQHVFELVLRLKQICNFDPATGDSAKFERLAADLDEVAASGRKAIVFSQWVTTLELLAARLAPLKPLLYHGGGYRKLREPEEGAS